MAEEEAPETTPAEKNYDRSTALAVALMELVELLSNSGQVDAAAYAKRLRRFEEAMRGSTGGGYGLLKTLRENAEAMGDVANE